MVRKILCLAGVAGIGVFIGYKIKEKEVDKLDEKKGDILENINNDKNIEIITNIHCDSARFKATRDYVSFVSEAHMAKTEEDVDSAVDFINEYMEAVVEEVEEFDSKPDEVNERELSDVLTSIAQLMENINDDDDDDEYDDEEDDDEDDEEPEVVPTIDSILALTPYTDDEDDDEEDASNEEASTIESVVSLNSDTDDEEDEDEEEDDEYNDEEDECEKRDGKAEWEHFCKENPEMAAKMDPMYWRLGAYQFKKVKVMENGKLVEKSVPPNRDEVPDLIEPYAEEIYGEEEVKKMRAHVKEMDDRIFAMFEQKKKEKEEEEARKALNPDPEPEPEPVLTVSEILRRHEEEVANGTYISVDEYDEMLDAAETKEEHIRIQDDKEYALKVVRELRKKKEAESIASETPKKENDIDDINSLLAERMKQDSEAEDDDELDNGEEVHAEIVNTQPKELPTPPSGKIDKKYVEKEFFGCSCGKIKGIKNLNRYCKICNTRVKQLEMVLDTSVLKEPINEDIKVDITPNQPLNVLNSPKSIIEENYERLGKPLVNAFGEQYEQRLRLMISKMSFDHFDPDAYEDYETKLIACAKFQTDSTKLDKVLDTFFKEFGMTPF